MPFTFSHPAIVLPVTYLPGKWYSLTGLVIGSLTPDFEYFLGMKVQSNYSHTLSGVFWFDLTLGILLAFIFHNIVRNKLFYNLPTVLKTRLLVFNDFNWNYYFKKNWFVVIVSIIIGALSHIFWDSFTHDSGFFVKTIPYLKTSIDFLGIQLPIFKILQHGSTIIGAIIIVYTILKLPANKKIISHFNLEYWGLLTVLTLTIISLKLFSGLDYRLYGQLIVTGISAGLISLILTSYLTKQKSNRC
jgi:hypothetical protein